MPAPDEKLERLLATNPVDAGCGDTLELLDVYVDLMLAGGDPEERYPEVAAHLRDCLPCDQDLEGLIAAARGG